MCCRCISTGRVCEGYGIWGGGGNHYGGRSIGPDSNTSLKNFFAPILVDAISKEEGLHLEWFTYRTAQKLPGVFTFDFWDRLLFQAVSAEPAVLHAALALGSAHMREGLIANNSLAGYTPDKEELFTLQHYSKAIGYLEPHFLAKNNSSIRLALITCLVFIMMEYLRGHYKAGNAHLQTGLRLLKEFKARSNAADHYSLFQEPCCDSVDAWIIQIFVRLDVQAKFLGYGSQYLDFMLEDSTSKSPNPGLMFASANQARQHLDRLFNQILYLNHRCRDQATPRDQAHTRDFFAEQRHIKARVRSWYQAFKAYKATATTKGATPNTIAHLILQLYYDMAVIMADTCLWPADESRYDAHTHTFSSMMDQMKYIRSLTTSPTLYGIVHFPGMSSSVADLGALPPVYYVAVKCRVRKIRYDALDFLSPLRHKEGIWNAPLVACITRGVVKIEEGDFYQSTDITDEKNPCNNLMKQDTREQILPESYRLHDIEVELPEDYEGTATMKCKRKLDTYNWEVITTEYVYDNETNSWGDL